MLVNLDAMGNIEAALANSNAGIGLQNLNFWDTIKNDAEKVGSVAWKGANWCYSNDKCKAIAEK